VRDVRERELKFDVDPGFELPDLAGSPLQPRVFTSTYYDTPEHRLAAVGITLRRRVENGRGLWQLKLPEGTARREIEAPGGPAKPPAEIADLLPALTRGRDLAPVAKLKTRREGVLVSDGGGAQAEVVHDAVTVLDARRVVDRFDELEVELVEGDDEALGPIGKALRRAGARMGELIPKVFRVLGKPSSDGAPRLAGEAEILRQALAEQVREILAHDPGTRLGADPEELHDMRVAVRRLRAFLKTAEDALEPEWRDDLRSRLKWLGGELGPVRDLDVLTERLRGETEGFEEAEARAAERLIGSLEQGRREARSALLAALRSDPYFELLDDLDAAAAAPRVRGDIDLAALATKGYRRLRKQAGAIGPDSSDDVLHEVRKSGKKARYAAELARPVAGKRAGRFVKEAKAFQDVVGDHQDAVVAEERLRELVANRSGATLLAAGRLIERERIRRAAARAAFGKAWRRLDKAGKAVWA
jgi:CHAD domain-containing protein